MVEKSVMKNIMIVKNKASWIGRHLSDSEICPTAELGLEGDC